MHEWLAPLDDRPPAHTVRPGGLERFEVASHNGRVGDGRHTLQSALVLKRCASVLDSVPLRLKPGTSASGDNGEVVQLLATSVRR